MKFHRTYGSHMKHLFLGLALSASLFLTACGNSDTAGTQARTDLTADHVRGLYSGMVRSDVEDLLGTGDKSLADHESIDVYSLSDGTTALLRYRDDTLMGAYLRDKDNVETSLFGQNATNMPGINGGNDTNSSLDTDGSGDNAGSSMITDDAINGTNGTMDMDNTTGNTNTSLEDSTLNNAADSATEANTETSESESR